MPTQEERNDIEAGIPETWDAERLARETYITSVSAERKAHDIIVKKLPCIEERLDRVEGEQKRLKRGVGAIGRRVRLQGELNGKPSESRPRNHVTKGPDGKPRVTSNGRRLTTGNTTIDITIIAAAFITFLGIVVQTFGG